MGTATKPMLTPTTGMPTMKLATSNTPVGAPTIALKTANAPLPGIATPTAPASPLAQTASLPKATVSLTPPTKPLSPLGQLPGPGAATKPLSSPSAGATVRSSTLPTTEADEDETGAAAFTKILTGVGLLAAIIVLSLQLKMSSIWIDAEDAEPAGDWMRLFE
jgi:hypothetical protein